MLRILVLVLLVLVPFLTPPSASAEWRLDGALDDWPAGVLAVDDPVGDDPRGRGEQDGRDIVHLRARATANWLHLGLRFDQVEEGDEEQGLLLLIDGDRDPSTGRRMFDMGCELVYDVAHRVGELHLDGETETFDWSQRMHERVGALVAPTVTSSTLEIALPRTMKDGRTVFSDPRGLHLLVYDQRSDDRAPQHGTMTLLWDDTEHAVASIPLDRAPDTDLRVAAYNVEHDGLFETDDTRRQDALRRLLRAIDADVWVFCEVWDHDGPQVRDRFGQLLDRDVASWATARQDAGNVILSRFPITRSWEVIDDVASESSRDRFRLTAALVDAPGGPVLVVANHWRCCDADAKRQIEADGMVRFLRDARTPGDRIDLPAGTPIVLAGDFNLVGLREPLDTLLAGDVADEARFGPDAPAAAVVDVPLRHPQAPWTHTWHVADSRYGPGRLDWVFVNDAVEVARALVLDTGGVDAAWLESHGLDATDSRMASDHFPLVVDLRRMD